MSRRIRLGDRENAWNVYHHNDPWNVPSQSSCVDCPEEEEQKEHRLHFPHHVSSCGDPLVRRHRLPHAYVDDGLSHSLYLYRGGCAGRGRDRGAFGLCLFLVPCPGPCEICRASHGYGLTVSYRRIPVRGVCHDGLFP